VDVHYYLGIVYDKLGEYAKATEAYRNAERLGHARR
jgi:cytochrome c-type biogenesis protein CcmH/NrfG